MTLVEMAQRLVGVEPARRELAGVLHTIRQRLGFLIRVGLGYLNLERVAGTLSAGEVQRIRLASQLGSGLTALTVSLDEPTRGRQLQGKYGLWETEDWPQAARWLTLDLLRSLPRINGF